jgi:hypothetical protein
VNVGQQHRAELLHGLAQVARRGTQEKPPQHVVEDTHASSIVHARVVLRGVAQVTQPLQQVTTRQGEQLELDGDG